MEKLKSKKIIIIVSAIVLVMIVAVLLKIFVLDKMNKPTNEEEIDVYETEEEEPKQQVDEKEEDPKVKGKVDIVDVNSKTRPFAVVVNNTPVAVKVQEGLNKAYIVYEIPTEGNTSRLLAFYKDINESLVVGTIRSARHNFIDYALESDAVFCCFGWSKYAEADLRGGSIDYLQGLYGGPYYRNNPEGLATEHTAYTNISSLISAASSAGVRLTTDKGLLLNYDVDDVDLSKAKNVKVANSVTIPYGAAPQIASFKYSPETKMYTRYENNVKCIDHNTKEDVTTKNIIVQKINYSMCDNNYYWDLKTIGSGEGYYITNGHAVPIIWNKTSRTEKTKYTYAEGTIIDGKDVSGKQISVSDGRTWIEIQTIKQVLTIE